jgi:chromosome segregation ATPase
MICRIHPPSPPTESVVRESIEERNTCGNQKCLENRRELAKLRGKLFDKESQLLSSQEDLKEYEATEILRRNTLADAEFQLEKEKQRAEAAEQDCMLRIEGQIKLLKRIGVLESKVAEMNDLEQYITELEREIMMLKGLGKSAKGKRMLAEMELDSDRGEMEGAVRAGKHLILEDSD